LRPPHFLLLKKLRFLYALLVQDAFHHADVLGIVVSLRSLFPQSDLCRTESFPGDLPPPDTRERLLFLDSRVLLFLLPFSSLPMPSPRNYPPALPSPPLWLCTPVPHVFHKSEMLSFSSPPSSYQHVSWTLSTFYDRRFAVPNSTPCVSPFSPQACFQSFSHSGSKTPSPDIFSPLNKTFFDKKWSSAFGLHSRGLETLSVYPQLSCALF